MNEEVMKIYESLSKPPETVLKKITGGRLKGMTDVKPQWRIETMTKTFGMCGVGWKYTIDKLWLEKGGNDEVVACAHISLYIKNEETWSEAIPGIGGSMLVAKESGGLHSNDEAYKMAITDALSVAMKHIGMAASIYMGEWDGSKYRDDKDDASDKVKKAFAGTEVKQHPPVDVMKMKTSTMTKYSSDSLRSLNWTLGEVYDKYEELKFNRDEMEKYVRSL